MQFDKQGRNREKVGKNCPPQHSQWKQGQSGNPNGRPPKHECFTSLLKEEITKIDPQDKEGRTWLEIIVRATLELAIKGNATALKEVWQRVDGRPPQAIDLNTNVRTIEDELADLPDLDKWQAT
ncbi:MAG: hypothetical protein A2W61_07950 [Deltaproteobacteria bacterium RIFCSPLOWO2_01_44_7]|nr:MAG: hypothetical protein A2712_10330 [Deltaproteobacteria bacterium RIFCSPHIGHO2_01_FULL_43_49]OGQ15505.1 MAG: hypothetical protein A3D22_10860 [Deltaproteobacteria bacterium RIFCSPHIGHO2_02_FULL_44_53]OGQ28447.1 MAG: hypothetical protein A3D98_03045 [Deltaproteobacteria bacterium RIFCSPHIGHO2_12_FULL_44_21]OGQ32311.1 MAG: hypothetical protein A2979_00705 [Deltaproteobacteria bacterium RIFCSPLOWO2_01_FULL_45_74]OGQ37674.1 MAG: hypothetical protein A2W61_07950 [Deltaproteobacteria bacterium 